ncbi:MAG: transposase [Puniceicoccaceae bacterium]|nr:MAG: transposase [Puniceicoccaceae bacterium]
MARKLRIEYPGALYHVINRGNYRADIFETEGARLAFENCLAGVCGKTGWRIHAYVLMRNHYHIALETPEPNLVVGMKWLQSTFANRFNRFRQEHGHVFQGRYQAIVLEGGERLGAVAHYIHLNPVRAGIVEADQVARYRWSSLYFLVNRRLRPGWLTMEAALNSAGGLADTPVGRGKYLAFLGWLSEDEATRKQLAFDQMCRGWAMGSKQFQAGLIAGKKAELAQKELRGTELCGLREQLWEALLDRCLKRLGHTREEARLTRKAAPWKVAIASHLRAVTTADNRWLAEQLAMGTPNGVSRYVGEVRRGKRPGAAALVGKISRIGD